MRFLSKGARRVAVRLASFCIAVPALGLSLAACSSGSPSSGAPGAGSSAAVGGSGLTAGSGGGGSGAAGGTGGQNPDLGSPIQKAPTYRLTNREYVNSVHDLLRGVTVTTPLDPDGAMAGYHVGLVAGDATVSAYHSAAVQAASSADLNALSGCDAAAVTATPAECGAKLIDALASKAFRRPVDAETRAALGALYTDVAGKFGFAAGGRAVIEQLLQSPYFLYHLELEEQAQGAGAVRVAGYSMASRLSYLIWGTMPDDSLFAKAAAGELSSTEQVEAEARRLLADPRAHTGLFNFYEQWLRADRLPPVKGGKYQGVYDDAMRASIMASFNAQVDASLWQTNGVQVLLTAKQAFVNQQTASLFGVSGIQGSALQVANLDPAQRSGILTHPAILGSLATEDGTHPIKRGVFVWDQVLCQELPNPPNDIPTFPGVPENQSVRQAFETFTAAPNCMACHRRINPVGFLFENYDALGAWTTVDDNGQPVVAASTIVSAQTPDKMDDAAVNKPTANLVELAQNLSASASVAHCLVTQLYRYTVKRHETSGDEASINTLAGVYANTAQSLPELLVGLTKSEAFTNRWNEQ